jgi:hypothetical protein
VTIFSPAKTPVPGYVSGSTTVPKWWWMQAVN